MGLFTERDGPTDREIWIAGYKAAVDDYALWRNGEQLIGCMQRRKQDVLAELEASIRPDISAQLLYDQAVNASRKSNVSQDMKGSNDT